MSWIRSRGHHVVLSGIGGDEITGGVPAAIPELANLFARAEFGTFARQLKAWAIAKRTPWLHLLFDVVQAFQPLTIFGVPKHKQPAPWLTPPFVKRNREALRGYPANLKLFPALPSLQANIQALDGLRRQLSCSSPRASFETRYPYLDRDLVEFMYAIPREQVVRPHQRRSLMRRALVGIVPDAILNRRRKAFVTRAPMVAIAKRSSAFIALTSEMVCGVMGLVDEAAFSQALNAIERGHEIPITPIMRTLALEGWLRHVMHRNLLDLPGRGSLPRTAPKPNRDSGFQLAN